MVRLLGSIDVLIVVGAVLLVFSTALGLANIEERWPHSLGALLWISGLSALVLDVVGRLG